MKDHRYSVRFTMRTHIVIEITKEIAHKLFVDNCIYTYIRNILHNTVDVMYNIALVVYSKYFPDYLDRSS